MSTVTVSGAEPGTELTYAQIVTPHTNATTTLSDVVTAPAVTVGLRPIIVRFVAAGANNNGASGGVKVHLLQSGTDIGQIYSTISAGASTQFGVYGEMRLAPTPGSYTYKIQAAAIVSGTETIAAGSGAAGVDAPAYIQIIQV